MNKELKQIEKITLSAMLLAISVILGSITKMISIPHLSFISISFTPTIVIFASLTLGPIYGAIIGGLADLLPAFIMPTGAYNFLLTIVYVLLGIFPWLIEKLTKRIRKFFPFSIVTICLIFLVLALEIYFFYGTDILDKRLSYYSPYVKIIILSISVLMDIATSIALILTDYHFKKKGKDLSLPSPSEIAFISFFLEITLLVLLRGLAYYLYFIVISSTGYQVAYELIISMLCISAPLDILLISFLIPPLMKIYTKNLNAK